MKVVILAGGLGTRLAEETDTRPKPMVEIGGMPILWHIMKSYSSFGYNDFVVALGYKGDVIKEFFQNYKLHKSDMILNLKSGDINFENDASDFGDKIPDAEDDLILFAMIGIQISYPKIFRLIIQASDIFEWDKGFANKNSINLDSVKSDIQKYGDSDKLDEDWEQIIYGACQKDIYLQSKVFNIIELFNYLRDHFEGKSEILEEKIVMALKFAAITNVDDDTNMKGAIEKRGRKSIFSDIKTKVDTVKQELITNGAKKEGVEIKIKTYQLVFESFLQLIQKTNGKFAILGSYIKFEQQSVIAKLYNPPKQTELITMEISNL